MKRIINIMAAIGLCAAISPAPVQAEIVTSPPDGGTVKLYDRSGEAYYNNRSNTKAYSDMLTEIVEYPDGTVYWKNPVSQIGSSMDFTKDAANAYIKGQISGDNMTFTLPQDLCAGQIWNEETINVPCAMLDVTTGFFPSAKKAADQTLVFKRNSEGAWVMQGTSSTLVMGAFGGFGGDDVFEYGDFNVVLTPSSQVIEDPVAFPAGAEPESWVLFNSGGGRFVKVYVDGNDIYVSGLFTAMPDAVVKGVLTDGVCKFATGQFLGMSSTGAQAYFASSEFKSIYDVDTDKYIYTYEIHPSLDFKYDATLKELTLTSTVLTAIITSKPDAADDQTPLATASLTRIAWQPADIDTTPCTPVLSEYVPYSDRDKEGRIDFTLPCTNTEGQLLDSSKLFWRVLVDDKVFEIKDTDGHYYGVKDVLTDISYGSPIEGSVDGFIMGIYNSGQSHTFTFYVNDFSFIGVQALYKDGANVTYSGILSANGAEIPSSWTGTQDEPIYEAPEGDVKNFYRSGSGWLNKFTRYEMTEIKDVVTELVFTTDGEVYMKSPLVNGDTNDWNHDTYIRGTYTDDTMTFEFPQIIDKGRMFSYDENDPSTWENVYKTVCQLYDGIVTDKGNNRYDVKATPSATQTLVYRKGADGSWKMESTSDSFFLGASGSFTDAAGWVGFGEWGITLAPAEDIPEAVVIPSTATGERWAMKYDYTGHFVNVYFDGDDIYIQGVSRTLPEAAIKGRIENGKAQFASPQYLGVDGSGNLLYAFSAEQKEFEDPGQGIYYTYYTALNSLSFNYDKETKTLTGEGILMVADNPTAEQIRTYSDIYEDAVFAWQPEDVDKTPAAPILSRYTYNEKDKEGVIEFYLTTYNAEGQLIDSSKLYYNIIANGEVYELAAQSVAGETYPAMKDIPYSFRNYVNVFATGTSHTFYLPFENPDIIQLRALYKADETSEPIYSDKTLVFSSVGEPAAPEIRINGKVLLGNSYEVEYGTQVEISFSGTKEGESVWYRYNQYDYSTTDVAGNSGFVKYEAPFKVDSGKVVFYAENDVYGLRSAERTVEFKFSVGIDSINGIDSDDDSEAEYYDLNGLKVNRENIIQGIYLRRTNSETRKVIIR